MGAAAVDRSEEDDFVRLAASHRMGSDPDRIANVLMEGRPWRSDFTELEPEAGVRRFAIDLRLRVGSDTRAITTFGKAARVDVGPCRQTSTGWEAPISWRAASAAPLFPVFAGLLSIEQTEMRIGGFYAPPAGAVGRVADRVLLHAAANWTARWVLAQIDSAAPA